MPEGNEGDAGWFDGDTQPVNLSPLAKQLKEEFAVKPKAEEVVSQASAAPETPLASKVEAASWQLAHAKTLVLPGKVEAKPLPEQALAPSPLPDVKPLPEQALAPSPATDAKPLPEQALTPSPSEEAKPLPESPSEEAKPLPEQALASSPGEEAKPLPEQVEAVSLEANEQDDDLFFAEPESFLTREAQFACGVEEEPDDEGFNEADEGTRKKPKAKARGRPKGKAKAKGAPKSKANQKASTKSEATPKASAKSKATPKAKASAKSKATPKASAKSAAKAKACGKRKAKAKASRPRKPKANSKGALSPEAEQPHGDEQGSQTVEVENEALKAQEGKVPEDSEDAPTPTTPAPEDPKPSKIPKGKAPRTLKTEEAANPDEVPAKTPKPGNPLMRPGNKNTVLLKCY